MALGVICGKYPRHSYKKTGSQTKDEEEEKEEENKRLGVIFWWLSSIATKTSYSNVKQMRPVVEEHTVPGEHWHISSFAALPSVIAHTGTGVLEENAKFWLALQYKPT